MANLHELQARSMTAAFLSAIKDDQAELGRIVSSVLEQDVAPEKIEALYRQLNSWRAALPPSCSNPRSRP